jgi:hypothetical protein
LYTRSSCTVRPLGFGPLYEARFSSSISGLFGTERSETGLEAQPPAANTATVAANTILVIVKRQRARRTILGDAEQSIGCVE